VRAAVTGWTAAARGDSGVKSDTRDTIVDAARECIQQFGLSNTTAEKIAERAGISRRTLYRHFDGRRHVIGAVLMRASAETVPHVDRRMRLYDEPLEMLVEGFLASLEAVRSHPVLAILQSPDDFRSLVPPAWTGTPVLRQAYGAYAEALPAVAVEDLVALSEQVTRLLLATLWLGDRDPLQRDPEKLRERLRSWLGPHVAHHCALQQAASRDEPTAS